MKFITESPVFTHLFLKLPAAKKIESHKETRLLVSLFGQTPLYISPDQTYSEFISQPNFIEFQKQLTILIDKLQYWCEKNIPSIPLTSLDAFRKNLFTAAWVESNPIYGFFYIKKHLEKIYLYLFCIDNTSYLFLKKDIIAELIPKMYFCAPGLNSYLEMTSDNLLMDNFLHRVKLHIIQQCALTFTQDVLEGSIIHYVNALTDSVASQYGLTPSKDILSPFLSKNILSNFKINVRIALSSENILAKIVDYFLSLTAYTANKLQKKYDVQIIENIEAALNIGLGKDTDFTFSQLLDQQALEQVAPEFKLKPFELLLPDILETCLTRLINSNFIEKPFHILSLQNPELYFTVEKNRNYIKVKHLHFNQLKEWLESQETLYTEWLESAKNSVKLYAIEEAGGNQSNFFSRMNISWNQAEHLDCIINQHLQNNALLILLLAASENKTLFIPNLLLTLSPTQETVYLVLHCLLIIDNADFLHSLLNCADVNLYAFRYQSKNIIELGMSLNAHHSVIVLGNLVNLNEFSTDLLSNKYFAQTFLKFLFPEKHPLTILEDETGVVLSSNKNQILSCLPRSFSDHCWKNQSEILTDFDLIRGCIYRCAQIYYPLNAEFWIIIRAFCTTLRKKFVDQAYEVWFHEARKKVYSLQKIGQSDNSNLRVNINNPDLELKIKNHISTLESTFFTLQKTFLKRYASFYERPREERLSRLNTQIQIFNAISTYAFSKGLTGEEMLILHANPFTGSKILPCRLTSESLNLLKLLKYEWDNCSSLFAAEYYNQEKSRDRNFLRL